MANTPAQQKAIRNELLSGSIHPSRSLSKIWEKRRKELEKSEGKPGYNKKLADEHRREFLEWQSEGADFRSAETELSESELAAIMEKVAKHEKEENELRAPAEQLLADVLWGYINQGLSIKGKEDRSWIDPSGFRLPTSLNFDQLRWKTDKYLNDGFQPGYVNHKIEHESPAIMIWRLWQVQEKILWELGTLTIVRSEGEQTEIRVSGVPSVFIIPVPEKIEENITQDPPLNQEPLSPERESDIVALPAKIPENIDKLNRLAVKWVKQNYENGYSRAANMKYFLGENAEEVLGHWISPDQFKKHLRKAYRAGLIDKNKKTNKYIPKLAPKRHS
jgi:hypothetical protein